MRGDDVTCQRHHRHRDDRDDDRGRHDDCERRPGFEISLTDADGADVTTLAAGQYTIEVDDQSDIHNFHLTGAGVDESTEVSAVGAETWEVAFEAGTYDFVCDPHASTMSGASR